MKNAASLISVLFASALVLSGCASNETVKAEAEPAGILSDTAPSEIPPTPSDAPTSESPQASTESEPLAPAVSAPAPAAPGNATGNITGAAAAPAETAMGASDDTIAASDEAGKEQAAKSSERTTREPTIRYLSADDSNSAASPVIVRKLIREGRYVPPAVVRTYEFLNYYSFDYAPPQEDEIRIHAQMRRTGIPDEFSLQIALRAFDSPVTKPINATLLVDTSGSMAGESISLAKKFILRFAESLAHRTPVGDRISIIAVDKSVRVLLDSHKADSSTPQTLVNQILPKIRANDITNLEKGIEKAYELAFRNYGSQYLNRVIVISDGAANAGELSVETISRHAEDTDRQGIYLAGIGLGEGFNDQLMDTLTDKGRGAYLFVDSEPEIDRILGESQFAANFDIAVKDVRLKMTMPPGWRLTEFHGEQVSAHAEDVIPQYLSPNDQMIYHLVVSAPPGNKEGGEFIFEAEYTPLGKSREKARLKAAAAEMINDPSNILKGDALVSFAESLKEIRFPPEDHREENTRRLQKAVTNITVANKELADSELGEILSLLSRYQRILSFGEQFSGAGDKFSDDIAKVLGISGNSFVSVAVEGSHPHIAINNKERLSISTRLVPMEGYKFLCLSSGPVGNPEPAGGEGLSDVDYPDPAPAYMGRFKSRETKQRVYDLHQVVFRLQAPSNTRSFSFDFDFFSAEYPDYVNQDFNDTFYAILEAESTNNGKPTNIAFDSSGASIEVDNNYFQNPFHPIPNTGTGFDYHGSTGWLRTSWPISGGEKFTLTFSIHDEGDAIYDSLAVIDNFRFHEYEAVGTTDPLN